MAKADANRLSLRRSVETNWGETPATPTMQILRPTSENLIHDKTTLVSAEIRSDRQVPAIGQVGVMASGGFEGELSYQSWDKEVEAALGSTYTVLSLSSLTLTFATPAKTITRSAGSWVSDGVVVGMYVRTGGLAASGGVNNAIWRVITVTALVLTVEDPDAIMVNEGPVASCTTKAGMIRNGTTPKSHLYEAAYLDIGKFQYFNGCRIGQLSLTAQVAQFIKMAAQLMGKQGVAGSATISGSTTAALTTEPFTANTNMGFIRYAGSPLTIGLKRLDVNAQNNLRSQTVVGQVATGGIGYGRFECKGQVEAYFEDIVLLQAVQNHSTVTVSWRFTDSAGNAFIVTVDSAKLRGNPTVSGVNTDVMATFDFEAQLNATYGCMVQIDQIAA